jgi:hypothetical protein
MSRYGNITIDGFDGWNEFGIFILKEGLNDWLAFPAVKDRFSHDWKDEDGIEIDTGEVYLKEKNVSLRIIFVAGSPAEFWENYEKLQLLLISGGVRKIRIGELGRDFEACYLSSSEVSKPKPLRGTEKIILSMNFHFLIPVPRVAGKNLFYMLSDEAMINYITTEDLNNLII